MSTSELFVCEVQSPRYTYLKPLLALQVQLNERSGHRSVLEMPNRKMDYPDRFAGLRHR
jgi:hypothetical protein